MKNYFVFLLCLFFVVAFLKPVLAYEFEDENVFSNGYQRAAEIERKFSVVRDPVLNDYLDRLGNRLVRENKLNNVPYTFSLIESPSFEIIGLPGGYIYVTTAILESANDENALASAFAVGIGKVNRNDEELTTRLLEQLQLSSDEINNLLTSKKLPEQNKSQSREFSFIKSQWAKAKNKSNNLQKDLLEDSQDEAEYLFY